MSILFFEWPQCFVKFFVKSINETEILEQSNQTTAIRMTLRGVAIEDSGIYLCEGYNEYENVSATSKLIVWPKGKHSFCVIMCGFCSCPPHSTPPPNFLLFFCSIKTTLTFPATHFLFPLPIWLSENLFFKDWTKLKNDCCRENQKS